MYVCACHLGKWVSRNDDRTVLVSVRWPPRLPPTLPRLKTRTAVVNTGRKKMCDCCQNLTSLLVPTVRPDEQSAP